MKTLYFDCIAGASGDMILGALIDAGLDADWLRAELAKLPISGWKLETKRADKNGFTATKVDVIVGPQPHARPLPEIERVIRDSGIADGMKSQALQVVRIIGAEEARIHGMPIEEVHLHEVSGEDAIIDIVGSLLGVEHLGIQRIHQQSAAAWARVHRRRARADSAAGAGDGGNSQGAADRRLTGQRRARHPHRARR